LQIIRLCNSSGFSGYQIIRIFRIHIIFTSGFSGCQVLQFIRLFRLSGYQVIRIFRIHIIFTSGGQVDQVIRILSGFRKFTSFSLQAFQVFPSLQVSFGISHFSGVDCNQVCQIFKNFRFLA
jgi:hypothetical protein